MGATERGTSGVTEERNEGRKEERDSESTRSDCGGDVRGEGVRGLGSVTMSGETLVWWS